MLFSAHGSAGAWSVFEILDANDELSAIFGGRERWPVERARIFEANDDPLAVLGIGALARAAPSKFSMRISTLSTLAVLAGRSAGSWSILRILLGIDDLLVVFGLFHLRSSGITPLHPATSRSSDKLKT